MMQDLTYCMSPLRSYLLRGIVLTQGGIDLLYGPYYVRLVTGTSTCVVPS
jgi:hypothetical protein